MRELWNLLGVNAAAIVALCALFLSLYQATMTRYHNRLSVRPKLISQYSYTAEIGKAGPLNYKMTLMNCGIGPAIVKELKVLFDGKVTPFYTRADQLSVFDRILPDHDLTIHSTLISDGAPIAKDESVELLIASIKLTAKDDAEQIVAQLERITVWVQYESMYGEIFEYDSAKKSYAHLVKK